MAERQSGFPASQEFVGREDISEPRNLGRMRILSYIALLALLGMAEAQTTAPPRPNLQLSARVVTVTIVATRSNGTLVKDLRASELHVSDNGKPQVITSFEPLEAPQTTSLTSNGASPTQPATPSGYPHFTIILLDALNTGWSDQVFARRAVEHLLDYFPPGQRIALFALSNHLYLLHNFSSDPVELRAALHRLTTVPPRGGTSLADTDPLSAAVCYSDLVEASNQARLWTRGSGPEARLFQRNRILDTFNALAAIARLVKSMPGQKDLLWVSGAFPLLVHGRSGLSDNDLYYDQAQQIARALSSAGLRIYPIDARGLSVSSSAYVNIGTMRELAEDTGGKAFYNSNNLESLMRQALEDSREGYLLTYAPSKLREDGSFHTIRIRVSRPGINLRYRPGYYAESSVLR